MNWTLRDDHSWPSRRSWRLEASGHRSCCCPGESARAVAVARTDGLKSWVLPGVGARADGLQDRGSGAGMAVVPARSGAGWRVPRELGALLGQHAAAERGAATGFLGFGACRGRIHAASRNQRQFLEAIVEADPRSPLRTSRVCR